MATPCFTWHWTCLHRGWVPTAACGVFIYHHRFASCLSRCSTPKARSGLVNVVYRRASHPGIRLCSAVSTHSVCHEAYCHPKHWCVRLGCSDCSSSCSMAHSGTSIGLYKKAISAPQDKILLTDCQHVKISVGRFSGQYLYGMVVCRSGGVFFRVRLEKVWAYACMPSCLPCPKEVCIMAASK